MLSDEHSTPKRLRVGDLILVKVEGELVVAATSRRGSVIAKLLAEPERAANPVPGKKAGYTLRTTAGVTTFVSGIQGVLLATSGDVKRVEREERDRVLAARESAGSLNGVTVGERAASLRPVDRPAATPLRPAVKAAGPTPSPRRAPVSDEVMFRAVRADRAGDRFRAMARVSRTVRARVFWEARAEAAGTTR